MTPLAYIETRGKRGPWKFYTFEELERLLVYTQVKGHKKYAEARTELAGDRGGPHRRKLGFDHGRDRTPCAEAKCPSRNGVPVERTMDRYLALWPDGERAQLFDQCWAAFRDQWVTQANAIAKEECRRLTLDGTVLETHYRCPWGQNPDGTHKSRIENGRDTVTCLDGGVRGGSHAGNGWTFMPLNNARGRTLAYVLAPHNISERTLAAEVLRVYEKQVRPKLAPDELCVLSADAGFDAGHLRRQMRALGLLPNIRVVSGAQSSRSRKHHADLGNKRYRIRGSRNADKFEVDGFREVHCLKHGKRPVTNRSFLHPDGHAVERIEAHCKECNATPTVTAGTHRVARAHGKLYDLLVPRRPNDPPSEDDDERFGSPMTENSRYGAAFGKSRFPRHEGFNAGAHTRFKLLAGKGWYRRRDRAHQDVALNVFIRWALSEIGAIRGAALAAGVAPPGIGPPGALAP